MRNNGAESFAGNPDDIRVDETEKPSKTGDGRWTDERTRVQSRIQRDRITKHDIDEFGSIVGCPGMQCNQRQQKGTGPFRSCREEIAGYLRITPQRGRKIGSKE